MSRLPHQLLFVVLGTTTLTSSAAAQLLPSLPQVVPNVPVVGEVLRGVRGEDPRQPAAVPFTRTLDTLGLPDAAATVGENGLLNLRKLRLRQLVRDHRQVLEMDDNGNPVRRGEILTIDPDPASLAAARAAGFAVLREEVSGELGLRTVVLSTPRKMSAEEALKRLRKAAPALEADYNHVFEPAGGVLAASGEMLVMQGGGGFRRIAMVDGGVASHPSLAGASIEQRAEIVGRQIREVDGVRHGQ